MSGSAIPRCSKPVFVVGCPRSGTTLLASFFLSSGQFSRYRFETHFFDQLEPRFGPLTSPERRARLLVLWMESEYAVRSELSPHEITSAFSEARNGETILRNLMDRIAHRQGVARWCDATPSQGLFMDHIGARIPDAQFIHVIRDGRDVALSLDRLAWGTKWPWPTDTLALAALRWSWTVKTIRRMADGLGPSRYMEVYFRDLVLRPAETLDRIGKFTDITFSIDAILANPVGSIAQPNTAFAKVQPGLDPRAVSRWRGELDDEQSRTLSSAIGPLLRELGFEVGGAAAPLPRQIEWRLFLAYRHVRHVLKRRPALARFLTSTELEETGGPIPEAR